MISRRSVLGLGVLAAWPGGVAKMAQPSRWPTGLIRWHVNEWPANLGREVFIVQCEIAMGHWQAATGVRFEYGGDDVIFYMSGALPTYTSARAEWPPPPGESRTCNVWLANGFRHTLHNVAGLAQGLSCNVLYELLHELGHVLGFEHTGRQSSVMCASLQYPFVQALDAEDVALAQARYKTRGTQWKLFMPLGVVD